MKKLLFLSLLLSAAAPLAAQRRVDFFFDFEGVRRTGSVKSYAPNTMRFEPSLRTGAGIGFGVDYFLSDRVSLEGKAAFLQAPMRLRIVGIDTVQIINLGDTRFYPVSVVLQWRPVERATFRPYLGAGIVHTIMKGLDKTVPNTTATSVAFRDPTGLVLDAGLEWSLGSRWSLFGDARYVPLESKSRATFVGTSAFTDIGVRPLIVSFGVARRF